MELLTSEYWTDYELIDSGGGEKLEQFGKYILRRPEPQALWSKSMSENEWIAMAHATFKREKQSQETEKGEWVLKTGMPGQWYINYKCNSLEMRMRMGLTSFKHVGIFPEQANNWNYIYETIKSFSIENPKVLNLFAYTGGASLAAKSAGADVVHVDSVKQVINWSAENAEATGLTGIRWVVEDAMKFVMREIKRGKTYNGIILDPPAYGRGPDGEKWYLEESLNELIKCCKILLEETQSFLVLNLYSMGFSALIAENIIKAHFPDVTNSKSGELYFSDRSGKKLPLGVFVRFNR